MANKCPAGAPLWMVTFADLMSLLLTLFVLLLTFAEMEVIKYKAVAGAIRNAFGIEKDDQLAGVIEIEGAKRRKYAKDVEPTREKHTEPEVRIDLTEAYNRHKQRTEEMREQARMQALTAAIRQTIERELAGTGTSVELSRNGVLIRFPNEIAFPSGSGTLTERFRDTLDKLADILVRTEGQIVVSGHTDNVPLAGGGTYRTNWDLSAARAASVVHYYLDDPRFSGERFTIQGFGESRPITGNDSPEGRAKNRRVELLIVSKPSEQGTVIPDGQ